MKKQMVAVTLIEKIHESGFGSVFECYIGQDGIWNGKAFECYSKKLADTLFEAYKKMLEETGREVEVINA